MDGKIIETSQFMAMCVRCVHGCSGGRSKARTLHKYTINTAEGKREIIRAPFNLRCAVQKDELNLAGAAGDLLAVAKSRVHRVRTAVPPLCEHPPEFIPPVIPR